MVAGESPVLGADWDVPRPVATSRHLIEAARLHGVATADCLAARELIKLKVLETSPITARETAEELAAKTASEVVLRQNLTGCELAGAIRMM